MLFPSDIQALLDAVSERLILDRELAEACSPLIELEQFDQIPIKSATVLARRLSLKSGVAIEHLSDPTWRDRINWEAAGFRPEQSDRLANLCQAVVTAFADIPDSPLTPSAASSRSVMLLAHALLLELQSLPDLGAADAGRFDAAPFFAELTQHLNALLPYEQRGFPTQTTASSVKLLFPSLPENAYYAVEIRPPTDGEPGQMVLGLFFEMADVEKLTRHFGRKIPGLSRSMGDKEITLESDETSVSVLLAQPFDPSGKLSSFMTAATLVGFIGSLQEKMPR